ncbi:MAG: PRD domain-containing protein [Holdemanella sp.]|nr:PRD domain-containing protein [Holdemanella sp.]
MKIKRILTNNAVVVIGEDGNDKIVCGKGIAFNKKKGETIDITLVNQVFILQDNQDIYKFEQLLKDVPIEYIRLAYDISEMVKIDFAKRLNDSMIVTLSDHLFVAIQRYKEGLTIQNALLWDIRNFYETEYEIGMKSLDIIEKQMGIRLPEDEAGFIALHIVNAQLDDSNMENIFKVTELIQEITTIVRYYFRIEFDTSSAYYYRFITHLKYFSLRLFNNKQFNDSEENDLFDVVRTKYQNAYNCALKIKEFLISKYSYTLSNDELLYITIHIHRVVSKTRKNG